MKRFLLVLAALAPLGAGACNKPTQEDCRKAISNVERLLGTEATARNTDNEAEVRRCRGGSTKENVACRIRATTVQELDACGVERAKGTSTGAGSAPSPGAPSPGAPSPGAPPPAAPTPGAPTPTPAPGTPPSSTK
ncbi:MAG TPA: hypothetical protein VHT91_10570 [Kofleriaceae bacterium]|nr:hypothetical protein [Kofleriaceae bacterium]